MDTDNRKYKDEVIFDLLIFLAQYNDLNIGHESWYSDIPKGYSTKLYSLFDDDQILKLKDVDFVITEKNKLLAIFFISGVDDDEDRDFFSFHLFKDADKFKLVPEEKEDGKCYLRVTDDDRADFFTGTRADEMKNKRKVSLNKLIRPVNFEELLERGLKGKRK